jgi:hypothetical protein
VGGGIRLLSGIIKLGYSLQYVNTSNGKVTADAASNLSYTNGINEGSALASQVGAMVTMPVFYLPNVSMVMRDIGNARFQTATLLKRSNGSPGAPPNSPMTMDLAFHIEPRLGRKIKSHFVFEDRDVMNRSSVPLMSRAAFGSEITFNYFFSLRFGYSGKYYHAGFGLKRERADINFAYYNEEVGTSSKKKKETVYLLQYQFKAF